MKARACDCDGYTDMLDDLILAQEISPERVIYFVNTLKEFNHCPYCGKKLRGTPCES